MKIEADGHLSLRVNDLATVKARKLASEGGTPNLSDFTYNAQIAAAYANRAGYHVTFVCPGQLIRAIKPSGEYFAVKRVKQYKEAKPVPKYAIGKCVDDFPSKKIFRRVGVLCEVERNGQFQGKETRHRWVVAPRGSSVEARDVWRDREPRR